MSAEVFSKHVLSFIQVKTINGPTQAAQTIPVKFLVRNSPKIVWTKPHGRATIQPTLTHVKHLQMFTLWLVARRRATGKNADLLPVYCQAVFMHNYTLQYIILLVKRFQMEILVNHTVFNACTYVYPVYLFAVINEKF